MFSKEVFCTRLKEERTKRNLTQSEVGSSFGVPKQYISRWEKGEQEPNMTMLYALAEYYDVSLDYLLGYTDNPSRL